MLNKNTIIPKEDVEKVKEIIEKVNGYLDCHAELTPSMDNATDPLLRIHTVLYLDMMKDIIRSAKALEFLLDCNEEDFVKSITEDGKRTIEEVDKKVMFNMLMEILTD